VLAGGALVLLAIVGLFDQIPGDARPMYPVGEVYQAADEEFFADMEAALPDDAMVFQLPVMTFPENPPIGDVGSYDHLRGYILGGNELRWSAGGVAGRESDWQEVWETQPVERMVEGLAAVGFDALYVDTWAYPDRGAALDEELVPLVGPREGESAYGRMRWYDLRDVEDRLAAELDDDELEELRDAVLATIEVGFDGIHAPEPGPDGPFRWMSSDASIELDNHGEAGREVVVRFTPVGPAGSTVVAEGPGLVGDPVTLPVGQPAELRLRLGEGVSSIDLSTDAPASGESAEGDPLHLRLVGLAVTDAVVDEILGPPA
jgi:phosphoglycerol transferase